MTSPITNTGTLDSIGKIHDYIQRHEKHLGFRPRAIGLSYNERVKVLKEMGASDFAARCTNVTASLMDVLLVEAV